jgi:hypothetical protein
LVGFWTDVILKDKFCNFLSKVTLFTTGTALTSLLNLGATHHPEAHDDPLHHVPTWGGSILNLQLP